MSRGLIWFLKVGSMEFVELNQINSGDIYDSKGRKLESSNEIELGGARPSSSRAN